MRSSKSFFYYWSRSLCLLSSFSSHYMYCSMITASIKFNKKNEPRKMRHTQKTAGTIGAVYYFYRLYRITDQLSSVII